jgi:transglutaminase-like putative cysteine protease
MNPSLPRQPVPDVGDGPLRVLRVLHSTRYDYDTPVEVAHHVAHLRPRETAWQRISDWQLDITPAPEGGALGVVQDLDSFGNWRHSFSHALVHEHLQVVSGFQAHLRALPPLALQASPPWEQVAAQLRYRAGAALPEACEFALGSPFAPAAPEFARFAGELFSPNRPLLEAALDLNRHVHRQMRYEPASTDVATHPAEALAQREGVCQDFAHIAIAVLRTQGLAARYVSGYLLTQPPPGQARLLGADASHAWFELWCPLSGWVALDPTNDLAVGSDHITLAWGRDYGDVAPLRGVVRGGGGTPPEVRVTVLPV